MTPFAASNFFPFAVFAPADYMRREGMPGKTSALVLFLIGVSLPALTLAQPPANSGPDKSTGARISQEEQKFLDYAAQDNQGEIQIAILAEKNAGNLAVKAFARLMIDDHAEVESRLAALVNQLDVKVPIGIGHEDEQIMQRLEPLTGSAFDREFIQAQIKDHSDDIKKFDKEEATAENSQLKEFVAQTIPILKQHLALAKAVGDSLHSENVGSSQPPSGGSTGSSSKR